MQFLTYAAYVCSTSSAAGLTDQQDLLFAAKKEIKIEPESQTFSAAYGDAHIVEQI